MHVSNNGPLGAALILAGVIGVPAELNLDEGSLHRHEEAVKAEFPNLSRDGQSLLAQVRAVKDAAEEIQGRRDEAATRLAKATAEAKEKLLADRAAAAAKADDTDAEIQAAAEAAAKAELDKEDAEKAAAAKAEAEAKAAAEAAASAPAPDVQA